MNRIPFTLVLVCAAIVTTACGGGGGADSNAPQDEILNPQKPVLGVPTTYAARNAWINLLTQKTSRSWVLVGKGTDLVEYKLTLGIEPPGRAVFPATFPVTKEGESRISLSNVIERDGTKVQSFQNEQFFNINYQIVGTRLTEIVGSRVIGNLDEVTCSRPELGPNNQPLVALPFVEAGTAGTGAKGPLYAGLTLTDCTPAGTFIGSRSYNQWSIQAEGAITYFCVATRDTPVNDPINKMSETCIETTPAGVLGDRARITLIDPVSLNLIAYTAN